MKRSSIAAFALLSVAGACARSFPPPGGEQDRTPPRLVEAMPEALAVLRDFKGPVVFRFDERISERGFSEALVVVSPLDSALRVDRGRSEVSVRIDGGWRADRVYRVVLLPGIRDLFGNQRNEPLELVFSTGPPVPSTAIAGIVTDRITGRAARDAVVTAIRRADSVAYMAVGDTAGFFALRHLPLGVYDLRAFTDQNRNRRRDAAEPVDTGFISLGAPNDTTTAMFTVLAPDSTAPRLSSAETVDSLHVRLTFDDYLDPGASLTQMQGRVAALPDSTPFAQVAQSIHPTDWDRVRRAVADSLRRTAADSARRAAAAADSTGVRPDSLQARAAVPVPAPQQRPANETILPNRSVIVRLDRALAPGTEYVIVVSNAANLHGLRGGGAEHFQTRPAPRDTSVLRQLR